MIFYIFLSKICLIFLSYNFLRSTSWNCELKVFKWVVLLRKKNFIVKLIYANIRVYEFKNHLPWMHLKEFILNKIKILIEIETLFRCKSKEKVVLFISQFSFKDAKIRASVNSIMFLNCLVERNVLKVAVCKRLYTVFNTM